MTMLQCEICGGKLKAKSAGIFECEFCGVEYDTAWAKAKIQEIKGTVQVEGTVEVTGTVKVEGSANLESFLKRGNFALEDQKWEEAKGFFENALNINAECAEAYLGQLLAELELPNVNSLANAELDYENNSSFKKAMLFANPQLKADLSEKLEAFRKAFSAHKAHLAVLRKRAEKGEQLFVASMWLGYAFFVDRDGTIQLDSRKCWNNEDEKESHTKFQQKLQALDGSIAIAYGDSLALGLLADGTVRTVDRYDFRQPCNVRIWTDITQISTIGRSNGEAAVGLKSDGTVVTTGPWDLHSWSDIVSIASGGGDIIGVKSDGTIVSTSNLDLSNWTDVVAADIGGGIAVGLRSDGTVLLAGRSTVKTDYGRIYDLSPVKKWRNIISVHTNGRAIVGLKADGTMVGVGWLGPSAPLSKHAIAFKIAASVNGSSIVCLHEDGTIEIAGKAECDRKLFDNIDNLAQERAEALQKREQERIAREKLLEAQRIEREKKQEQERIAREEAARAAQAKLEEEMRIAAQRRNAGLCQYCGGTLKGLFSKKCVSCGQPKNY